MLTDKRSCRELRDILHGDVSVWTNLAIVRVVKIAIVTEFCSNHDRSQEKPMYAETTWLKGPVPLHSMLSLEPGQQMCRQLLNSF